MFNTIICYMNGTNVRAEGEFNIDTNKLKVFKGSIFEKKEAASFSKHSYYKLRTHIKNSGILDENYKLTEDYTFDSPSAASSCILGRSSQGTIIWKTKINNQPIKVYVDSDETLEVSVEEKYKYLNKLMEDIEVLNQLKEETQFNIFETLKIERTEIRHSNVLAWLMDPYETHGLGQKFVQKFISDVYKNNKTMYNKLGIKSEDIFLFDYNDITLYREKKHIDILLVNEENKLIVIIENKIDSKEHGNQLQSYENAVENEYKNYKKMYVYLTRENQESSRNETWGEYSYSYISNLIDEIMNDTKDGIKTFLEDYNKVIRRKIMTDDKLKKICEDIYKKHSKALDLIFEYRPDKVSEIGDVLKKYIDDQKFIQSKHRKNVIRFSDETILHLNHIYSEEASIDWIKDDNDKGAIIIHAFKFDENKIRLVTVVGPFQNEERRIELIEHYKKNTTEKVRDGGRFSTIKATNLLKINEKDSIDDIENKINDQQFRKKLVAHVSKITEIFKDIVYKNTF